MVSLLVSSPRVRVFSEEGQPLAVQVSAHWSSATDMVPDVYQVRRALQRALAWSSADPWPLPFSTSRPPVLCSPAYSPGGAGVLGRRIAQRTVTRGI